MQNCHQHNRYWMVTGVLTLLIIAPMLLGCFLDPFQVTGPFVDEGFPVNIRVIDAETGKPISNAVVISYSAAFTEESGLIHKPVRDKTNAHGWVEIWFGKYKYVGWIVEADGYPQHSKGRKIRTAPFEGLPDDVASYIREDMPYVSDQYGQGWQIGLFSSKTEELTIQWKDRPHGIVIVDYVFHERTLSTKHIHNNDISAYQLQLREPARIEETTKLDRNASNQTHSYRTHAHRSSRVQLIFDVGQKSYKPQDTLELLSKDSEQNLRTNPIALWQLREKPNIYGNLYEGHSETYSATTHTIYYYYGHYQDALLLMEGIEDDQSRGKLGSQYIPDKQLLLKQQAQLKQAP